MRKIIAILLLCFFVSPAVADATFEEALALFDDGNYAEALPIAQEFAGKDDPLAMLMLGRMLQKGLGVEPDAMQAQYWFSKSADKGNVDAQLAWGLILLEGPNPVEAVPPLEKAAEAGNATAQYNLGIYYSGVYGAEAQWPQAAAWFQKAADQGLSDAQYNLALLYTDGRGVEKNAVKAADWFGKAALQGSADAALEYGVLVFRGEGVEKDEALGAKWLLIAANHGNPIAMNRVSKLYASGHGVAVDGIEAAKWNILASAGGRSDAELDAAAAKMDRQDLAQAKERADAFKPMVGPNAP
jgi:TPR repeat protein